MRSKCFGNQAIVTSSGAEMPFSASRTRIIKLIKDKYRSTPVVQQTRRPGYKSRTSYSVTPVRLGGMSAEAHTVDSCHSTCCTYGNRWMIHDVERVCCSDLESCSVLVLQKPGYFRANRNNVPVNGVWTGAASHLSAIKQHRGKAWQVCRGDRGVLQLTKFPPTFIYSLLLFF